MGAREFITSLLWEGVQRRVAHDLPRVIAITGGVGKTTTKEAIAAVLALTGKPVIKTPGNLNTDTGVALALLGYDQAPVHQLGWLRPLFTAYNPPKSQATNPYYVLEYSADHPGDIAQLCSLLPPDVAVLTAIVPAHVEYYPTIEALISEKRTIVDRLQPEGYAVVNRDDPNQDAVRPDRWVGYGQKASKEENQLVLSEIQRAGNGCLVCRISRVGKQSESIVLQTQLLAEHHLGALSAAAAVGIGERLSLAQMQPVLESLQPLAGRGRLIQGRRQVRIIDDTYNAAPAAVLAALQALPGIAGSSRRVAILGRMNELGDTALQYHKEVAEEAARSAQALVFVGEFASAMREAALAAGATAAHITVFATPEQLIDAVDQVVVPGDVVLVKASQNGMRLERVVKRLMLNSDQADQLLVRQGPYWKS